MDVPTVMLFLALAGAVATVADRYPEDFICYGQYILYAACTVLLIFWFGYAFGVRAAADAVSSGIAAVSKDNYFSGIYDLSSAARDARLPSILAYGALFGGVWVLLMVNWAYRVIEIRKQQK